MIQSLPGLQVGACHHLIGCAHSASLCRIFRFPQKSNLNLEDSDPLPAISCGPFFCALFHSDLLRHCRQSRRRTCLVHTRHPFSCIWVTTSVRTIASNDSHLNFLGKLETGMLDPVLSQINCWLPGGHFGQAREVQLEQAPEMRLEQSQEMKLEPRRYSNACLDEEAEQARAVNCVRLLQESILSPQDEDDEYYTTGHLSQHPQSPYHYSLAIDYTAAKMVTAVINKCKLFQCVSSLFKDESQELLTTLVGLHQILQKVLSSPCIVPFHETLKDVLLYTTKAFAFLEKLCFKALPHESTHGVQKAGVKMNEFACRFYNQTVRLCHDFNNNEASDLGCGTPRAERLSFGVTTYVVPVHNLLQRLLKKKRVHIPLTDLETTTSEYNVELSYPRSWFSRDVAMSAKVESSDRGVSQTLHADRVNIEKGSWGWEYAQDTVLITYDDFVVANVASVTGGILTYNKHSRRSSIKAFKSQRYRTSIQIVGASRIDLDLQDLFIKGVKEKELVFYKCFVNTTGREEVLGIYRFQPKQIKAEGMLHIVGRGNQPGLRHVLVSIFASLGFTPAA